MSKILYALVNCEIWLFMNERLVNVLGANIAMEKMLREADGSCSLTAKRTVAYVLECGNEKQETT